MKKLVINGAELHVASLGIVEDNSNPNYILYHVTCTVNKQTQPNDVAIAVLCSSMFKDVCELVIMALKHHAGVEEINEG